jgi:hypothetical protein
MAYNVITVAIAFNKLLEFFSVFSMVSFASEARKKAADAGVKSTKP